MKTVKLFIAATFLIAGLNMLAEKQIWYKGEFEATGSSKKTTVTKVVPLKDGITQFIYSFKDDKSGSAYAQFPMFTDKETKVFEIQVKGDGQKYFFEVWLEGKKGWFLQEKLVMIKGDKWQTVRIKIVDTKSTEAKYLRILFTNKENPEKGSIFLKAPKYIYDEKTK